ncbi:beta-galactosidase [Clostridium bowmanii]|uniref:beta-galactosidase n=1 Tax=Clostridium bowmanii TaxID=132925 RepID=UPI001C0DFC3E|nr:beta-galactosidase [Clostridium bowmanii]MBU3188130.1 beta-galactosidase [Clostridium bowmanii]MCA1072312.1 beta-galactosidase [Clostridium bowmanii]
MYLGVDYYPEHWDIDLMDSDLTRMVEMGVNTIRIGEFAWHMMESTEGKYNFTFFDNVIKKAKEYGLKVIFGTPTATFPAWLSKAHPSILSEDIDGRKRVFGGRRQYCFNSNIYRQYTRKIVEQLISHYRDEQAIIAWQIDNELGHEGSDLCYCDQCRGAFQKFLQDKYKTIENLNDTYGTIFWGQTYNSFDEIPIPKKTITSHNPSLQLDYARFRDYSINSYAKMQIDIVRKLKGEQQEVTHNFYGGFFDKCFNQKTMAQGLDFVSYDNYPVWGGLKEPLSPASIAMTHDYARGLKNKNYWIVEQLMGAQGHTVIGYLPRPNQAKMWSYQAMAHGCSNILFFRWRGMNKGAEQYCLGIIDQNNRTSRKYYEAEEFFKDISQYEELVNSEIKSEVAVLYCFDNIWSWKAQPQSSEFDFTNELVRLYTPFHNLNVNMDVQSVDCDFSKYKVLILPVMNIIEKSLAERLEKFTENGGIVIFSFRTGIKDENNNLYLGSVFPGYVQKLCGIEIEESESLQASQEIEILGQGTFENTIGTGKVWRDMISTTTAKVLFKYTDKFYSEKAAITCNNYGAGKVYYVGSGVDEDTLNIIAESIIKQADMQFEKTQSGVEVVFRKVHDIQHKFVINHNEYEVIYEGSTLKAYEVKII